MQPLRIEIEARQLNDMLKKHLKNSELNAFQQLLQDSSGFNQDNSNGKELSSCLKLACKKELGSEGYVKALLDAGVDPNFEKPLLHASYADNLKCMKVFLECERTDVNVNSKINRTILHDLCLLSYERKDLGDVLECISLTLKWKNFDVNKPDDFGYTAIMYAVECLHEERVKQVIKCGGDRVYIDNVVMCTGKTVREMIIVRFSEVTKMLKGPKTEAQTSADPNTRLLAALQNKDLSCFQNILNEQKTYGTVNINHLYSDPHYCTCLEMACKMEEGQKFVEALCVAGADIVNCQKQHKVPLIHFVMSLCNDETFDFLIKHYQTSLDIWEKDSNNHTVLHIAAERRCHSEKEIEKLGRCLQIFFDNAVNIQNEINCQDFHGETALHDAAQYDNNMVTLELLRHGANIMTKNKDGNSPLHFINSATLKTFLNEQLESNDYSPLNENYILIFDYSFLVPSTLNEQTTEMGALLQMTEPHLQELLTHPVLNSFLYLKWKLIEKFILTNIIFYVSFVVVFNLYILSIKHHFYNVPTSQNATIHESLPDSFTENHYGTYKTENSEHEIQGFEHVLLYFTIVFIIAILMKEIFQMAIMKFKYLYRSDNYLDLLIIGISISIVFHDYGHTYLCTIGVLLSWTKLIFLTGSIHELAIQLEMLKKVLLTFLQYMAWYFLLFIPFAFSFHILFCNIKTEESDSVMFFITPWTSLLKTIIMSTGELDLSPLVFDMAPGVAHIIFLFFVVIIVVVLLNLLTGLAVSDTQTILDNARVLSLVSLVKLVHHYEWLFMNIEKIPGTSIITNKLPKIHLFATKSAKKKIKVCNSKVTLFSTESEGYFKILKLEKHIIEDANVIIVLNRESLYHNSTEGEIKHFGDREILKEIQDKKHKLLNDVKKALNTAIEIINDMKQ